MDSSDGKLAGGDRETGRLVVVSNRLPIVVTREQDRWHVEPGSGGLVTALAPVLRNRGGIWIGWPGTSKTQGLAEAVEKATRDVGYSLVPVIFEKADIKGHYRGFSNEIIWPLFHDLQSECNFDPAYWESYRRVNQKFARAIAANTTPGDFVWVHDYHLMLVAEELRSTGRGGRLGFFLHIPFPSPDLFAKLPWRREVLKALLRYDVIGFQTMRDRRNFVECARTLVKDIDSCGRGQVCELNAAGETIRVGAFPISIDYGAFAETARSHEVAECAWHIHEKLPGRQIILGVDRMDYTKGITNRLEAFRYALKRYPELRNKVTLVQVVVPSRRGIPEYEALKTRIERLVGEINGQLTQSGWVPIHYIYRSLDQYELLAYYRTAEIALVTPLKDGMNLVAKEYCASSLEENGVLILSEFAGAAYELRRGALMVNPYDVVGVAETIYQAWKMTPAERHARMHRLRQSIKRHDIFWWVDSFLKASIAKSLDSFPVVDDYVMGLEPGPPEPGSAGQS
jgi:trehalose 6-phosphate synthase